MSQLEQDFQLFLNKRPEIEKCYSSDLINRRSLARYLIKQGFAKQSQFDALIAMLRRHKFRTAKSDNHVNISDIRMNLKDKIIILDFDKSNDLIGNIENSISIPEYEKGDALKIVIGTASVKIFIDEKNLFRFKNLISKYAPKIVKEICELSLLFPESAINSKGIISTITNEFVCNDIVITELLTATPELLIYIKDEHALKAFEIIKNLK